MSIATPSSLNLPPSCQTVRPRESTSDVIVTRVEAPATEWPLSGGSSPRSMATCKGRDCANDVASPSRSRKGTLPSPAASTTRAASICTVTRVLGCLIATRTPALPAAGSNARPSSASIFQIAPRLRRAIASTKLIVSITGSSTRYTVPGQPAKGAGRHRSSIGTGLTLKPATAPSIAAQEASDSPRHK